MNRTVLSKGSIEVLIHSAENMVDFILKLYSAVVPHDWDEIATFNGYPQINRATASWILEKAAEKFDQGEVNMLWLNKGFASDYDDEQSIKKNEELKDFEVFLPKDLYTLKPIYDKSDLGIEELFNENRYDDEQSIKKEVQ